MKVYEMLNAYDRVQAQLEPSLLRVVQRHLGEQGNLLPTGVQMEQVGRVLDVACGFGLWRLTWSFSWV